jgi:hypothetical protein
MLFGRKQGKGEEFMGKRGSCERKWKKEGRNAEKSKKVKHVPRKGKMRARTAE